MIEYKSLDSGIQKYLEFISGRTWTPENLNKMGKWLLKQDMETRVAVQALASIVWLTGYISMITTTAMPDLVMNAASHLDYGDSWLNKNEGLEQFFSW